MEKEVNIVLLLANPNDETTNGIFLKDRNWYHLYITTDEEIKDGDWFLMNGCILRQCSLHKGDILDTLGGLHHKSVCKKIIATTDKLILKTSKSIDKEQFPDILVPQIPQSFIDYFVEQYNKGNVIDKVLVEYLLNETGNYREFDCTPKLKQKLKINLDNTINILPTKDS